MGVTGCRGRGGVMSLSCLGAVSLQWCGVASCPPTWGWHQGKGVKRRPKGKSGLSHEHGDLPGASLEREVPGAAALMGDLGVRDAHRGCSRCSG